MSSENDSQLLLAEESNELRQGDICFEWPIPRWQLNGYMVASEPASVNPSTAIVALHSKGESLPLVVCSHDCDLENPRSRMGIVVVPLLNWPSSVAPMGSDASLDIVRSVVPDDDGSYMHINLYPIKLPYETAEWRIVDFSGLTSIGNPLKSLQHLMKAKRFEMTDECRKNFSNKLAAFFIRKS